MLLAIFLIIFSAIALHNIRNGAYLIIFLMPLYLWRFSIFGIPSTALEAMIYILFLVWIFGRIEILDRLKTVVARSKTASCRSMDQTPQSQNGLNAGLPRHFLSDNRQKTPRNFRTILSKKVSLFATHFLSKQFYLLNFGIILLFLGIIISTSISSDPRISLGILKGWFFDPFLFFLVFINIIKTKNQVVSSLAAWFSSGIAVSTVGIFYLLSGELTYDERLSAFFLSPNHLAMYISPVFLILLTFLLYKIKINSEGLKKLEIGNWGIGEYLNYKLPITNYQLQVTVLAIIFIPLYFTHSYGAFLGISAGLFYMFGKGIFKEGQSKKNKNYLAAALIILSLGAVFSYGKMGQIENSSGRSSFHSRLMIWSASLEMIKENPFVGIGPGTFQEKYLSLADNHKEPYLEWAAPQPHNIFLAFYLQTGLIGFAGFVLILFWFFQRKRHLPQLLSGSPSDSGINTIIISLMIYALIHGMVDTTYWKNDLALMFWLVVGIAVVIKKNRKTVLAGKTRIVDNFL